MTMLITLTEDEFDSQFPLVENHLNRHASWVIGDGPGCLFENYGTELAFVREQDARFVWTIIDGDDGDMYLVSGFHLVNRVGYLLSTVPVPADTIIHVHIPRIAEVTPSSSTD